MVAMALTAFGPIMSIKRLLVFAAVEQAGIGRVAKTAAPAHSRDAGWTGGMIAMASVTGRRTEVAAFKQGAAMDAGLILGQLGRRER